MASNYDDMPKGKIQTVCGLLNASDLGVTLCHEHLYHEIPAKAFHPRVNHSKHNWISGEKVTPDRQWWTTFHPYSHSDNLVLSDVKAAITEEMHFYRTNGGVSVVEVTTAGRDLDFLKQTSLDTGVNIIAGAGYYVSAAMPANILQLTTEQIYARISDELLVGVNGVKCGVIGELGCSWPLDSFERRVLTASGELQSQLRVPVIIHPGRDPSAPFECMRVFLEAGGVAVKTVMSHLDRTLDEQQLLEFAEAFHCLSELDLFGIECSYYEPNDVIDMRNDSTRIAQLKALIDEGYGDRITVSHDIHTKHRLMKFGGHGYSHILLNVVPKMRIKAFTDQHINDILVNNPREWLTL